MSFKFGARQTELLVRALNEVVCNKQEAKTRDALLDKLTAKRPTQVHVQPLQDAMVSSSGGKVVPIVSSSPGFWAKLSRQLTDKGATVEQAALIGSWLSTQSWLSSTITIESAVYKWESWLANAQHAAGTSGQGGSSGRRSEAW